MILIQRMGTHYNTWCIKFTTIFIFFSFTFSETYFWVRVFLTWGRRSNVVKLLMNFHYNTFFYLRRPSSSIPNSFKSSSTLSLQPSSGLFHFLFAPASISSIYLLTQFSFLLSLCNYNKICTNHLNLLNNYISLLRDLQFYTYSLFCPSSQEIISSLIRGLS